MNFIDEINELENYKSDKNYISIKGNIPILFCAAHTVNQELENGIIKKIEPYTKAISLYLNKYYKTYSFVKIKDTGFDANKDNRDEFKTELIRFIKDNNIKIIIDLHGASIDRDFDVEFGTLNNLTADYSTINELKKAFIENGIKNVSINDPFKGGAITQYLYGIDSIDVIQLEINGKYRNYNDLELLKKLIDSLGNFINQYKSY